MVTSIGIVDHSFHPFRIANRPWKYSAKLTYFNSTEDTWSGSGVKLRNCGVSVFTLTLAS